MSRRDEIEAARSEIRGYLKSSRLLMVVTETDNDVVRTYIMILSFGVEKSLKALRRHVDRVPPSRGHNILNLLSDLSDETRSWVWALSGAKPRHFEWALSANQNSFEEWRYAEEGREGIEFILPDAMMGIMEAALLMLRKEAEQLEDAAGGDLPSG